MISPGAEGDAQMESACAAIKADEMRGRGDATMR